MNSYNTDRGYLHAIVGCMFSGKSSSLIRHYRRHLVAKRKCLLIKYAGDTRYTDEEYIQTHDCLFNEKAVACFRLMDLEKKIDLEPYEVLCIDEIQFYPDNIEFCQKLVGMDKVVIVSGLYADYLRNPFPRMPELIALSDRPEFLTAICHHCHLDNGTTSYRIGQEKDQIVIGGSDKYLPLCQICYDTQMKRDQIEARRHERELGKK